MTAVLLAACSAGQHGGPKANPSIVGSITDLTRAPDPTGDQLGSILVEEKPEEQSGSAKARVTITTKTKLLRQSGDELSEITFAELLPGQQVKAWYTGPVAESYPEQATASVVLVVEETRGG